jgi:NAD(P)H dehydrogenase (quinone)
MSTQDLILVTGATGKIGSSIARQLERRGKDLRLLVRDPKKLSGFSSTEKLTGDYGDVESLDHAFRGVSSAFIVSGYAKPGERSKLHRNAFQAAQRAGVRYLIYLSTLGASANSRFPMSRDHYESEGFLKETGVPHTILRDSFYSELAVQMFDEDGRNERTRRRRQRVMGLDEKKSQKPLRNCSPAIHLYWVRFR